MSTISFLKKQQSTIPKSTDYLHPGYESICLRYLGQPVRKHRKQWEWVYIYNALRRKSKLNPESLGLGFGCGSERLIWMLLESGVRLDCTDLAEHISQDLGWHKGSRFDAIKAQRPDSCSENLLAQLNYSDVDMNAIPDRLLQGQYDFVWSSCALEHLGGINQGLDFIKTSLRALKVGGMAVHTTEFNLGSDWETMSTKDTCFYRRTDLLLLQYELEKDGQYKVWPFNFELDDVAEDQHYDLPPYKQDDHLRLVFDGYKVTSIGIVIERLS